MVRKVLIATDGSDTAMRAVDVGADLAAKSGVPVVLVHVYLRDHLSEGLRHMAEVEYDAAEGGNRLFAALSSLPHARFPQADLLPEHATSEDRVLSAVARSVLDAAERAAHEHGVRDVERVTDDGDPARRIVEAAEETGADMIVTGARGLSDLKSAVFGSVSHKVQHLSPVTVVTVR
ncbi:universal stress protein [Roseibacterium sp. SDUM158017]|uniref:universal stress protein n=1 Tax=Roseicyclus salinarum TaxID=3036773 RepID=UPI0024158856|nr:universal stress protein [Roseibacterium sp. SDUM158017]MDG4647354.1 universal stress protein [Roseibacterium sp. SDUM158017]